MLRLYRVLAKKAILLVSVIAISLFYFQPVLAIAPNDPDYQMQKSFYQQIGAEKAWDVSRGSKDVVVAVIDTGLDTSHNDLVKNLWTNIHEIPGNGIDDDHNGYVDDVHGWNFVENNGDVRTSVFNSDDDKEAVRHGTIIGGLVGAEGDNGINGTGINWHVSLMTLRAIKSSGSGSTKAVVSSVNYAVDNGANVISLSFMGDVADQDLYNALHEAYERGVVIIAAGGNYDNRTESGNLDKKPIYPACYDTEDGLAENWILSVGSIDENNRVSDFSDFGKCIDILAPGEYIYSTERYAPQFGYNNEFGGPWFGTSFAAPLAAGTAALILSIHPEWSPGKVISTIINTADVLPSGKRLNAGAALSFASAYPLNAMHGSVYYQKGGNEIWKSDLYDGTNKRISKFSDSKILAFNVYNNLNNEELGLLMKKGNSYSVRVIKNDGEFIKEVQLPSAEKIFPGASFGLRFVGNWEVVTSRKSKSGTVFTKYALLTRKILKQVIPGNVDAWSLDAGGNIVAGTVNGSTLSLRNIADSGSEKLEIPNIGKLHAISVRGQEIYALVQKGKGLYLLKLDFGSGNYSVSSLGVPAGKNNWALKSIVMNDKIYLMPFSKNAGSYAVYDTLLNPVITLNLGTTQAITQ